MPIMISLYAYYQAEAFGERPRHDAVRTSARTLLRIYSGHQTPAEMH